MAIRKDYTGIHQKLSADKAQEIAREYGERFLSGELDADSLRKILDELREEWTGRSVELTSVASGWRFRVKPEFQQYLDGLLARALNVVLGRREAFWTRDSYSAVRLETRASVVEKCAYVLANPVAAGLVRRSAMPRAGRSSGSRTACSRSSHRSRTLRPSRLASSPATRYLRSTTGLPKT